MNWVKDLTDAGRMANWLACCGAKGGRRARLLKGISAAPWVAGRLRTNYFEICFELSELVAASQRCNSDEISLGIMYKF